MGLPRSTFYDRPSVTVADAEIVGCMRAICEEFETYGYRRVGAALRQQGCIVNSKKVRRLMREQDLQPRRRRRLVATTDSAHGFPVFANLAREVVPDGPNQLWNGDITYVAVASGFVYVALLLDAWSRRVVGYAIGRTIDTRLVVAALEAALASRRPPAGCICHTDRGSQYASARYRELLAAHGLVGSMSRRGNPFDNAKAESLIKTLKVEAVHLPAGLCKVRGRHQRPAQVHRGGLQHPQTALCVRISEPRTVRESTRSMPCQSHSLRLSTSRGALHSKKCAIFVCH